MDAAGPAGLHSVEFLIGDTLRAGVEVALSVAGELQPGAGAFALDLGRLAGAVKKAWDRVVWIAEWEVEAAVWILDLTGRIEVTEKKGFLYCRLMSNDAAAADYGWAGSKSPPTDPDLGRGRGPARRRPGASQPPSPWGGWKRWGWPEINAAVDRTVAAVGNGAALRAAVDRHIARVNSVFDRMNSVYDRREAEITAAARPNDGEGRVEIDNMFRAYYRVKFELTLVADHLLIRMLKRATDAGVWRPRVSGRLNARHVRSEPVADSGPAV